MESLVAVLPVFIICLLVSVVILSHSAKWRKHIFNVAAGIMLAWVVLACTLIRAMPTDMQVKVQPPVTTDAAIEIDEKYLEAFAELAGREPEHWARRAIRRSKAQFGRGMPAGLVGLAGSMVGHERLRDWGFDRWKDSMIWTDAWVPDSWFPDVGERGRKVVPDLTMKRKATDKYSVVVADSFEIQLPGTPSIYEGILHDRKLYIYECEKKAEDGSIFYSLHVAATIDGKPIRYAADDLDAALKYYVIGYLMTLGIDAESVGFSERRSFNGYPAINYVCDFDELYVAGISALINGMHVRADLLCEPQVKDYADRRFNAMLKSFRSLE